MNLSCKTLIKSSRQVWVASTSIKRRRHLSVSHDRSISDSKIARIRHRFANECSEEEWAQPMSSSIKWPHTWLRSKTSQVLNLAKIGTYIQHSLWSIGMARSLWVITTMLTLRIGSLKLLKGPCQGHKKSAKLHLTGKIDRKEALMKETRARQYCRQSRTQRCARPNSQWLILNSRDRQVQEKTSILRLMKSAHKVWLSTKTTTTSPIS